MAYPMTSFTSCSATTSDFASSTWTAKAHSIWRSSMTLSQAVAGTGLLTNRTARAVSHEHTHLSRCRSSAFLAIPTGSR